MDDTASTPRSRAREQTMRDIVRIGRAHLATEGAAALSLRAVARDLGVVSSAVYRYVASRDELLTLLVVDGYDELGDAVDAAIAPLDRADHANSPRAINASGAVRPISRRIRARSRESRRGVSGDSSSPTTPACQASSHTSTSRTTTRVPGPVVRSAGAS